MQLFSQAPSKPEMMEAVSTLHLVCLYSYSGGNCSSSRPSTTSNSLLNDIHLGGASVIGIQLRSSIASISPSSQLDDGLRPRTKDVL